MAPSPSAVKAGFSDKPDLASRSARRVIRRAGLSAEGWGALQAWGPRRAEDREERRTVCTW